MSNFKITENFEQDFYKGNKKSEPTVKDKERIKELRKKKRKETKLPSQNKMTITKENI